MKFLVAPLVLAASFILSSSIALADQVMDANGVPHYTSWQSSWDHNDYDRQHVILGTVTKFQPYRLEIARRNGNVQTIDLKNGTVIFPTGSTPTENERVAVVGYYSNGTFIANRLIVRP